MITEVSAKEWLLHISEDERSFDAARVSDWNSAGAESPNGSVIGSSEVRATII